MDTLFIFSVYRNHTILLQENKAIDNNDFHIHIEYVMKVQEMTSWYCLTQTTQK